MDERKSVKGTNAARDKSMSTDSSAQAQTRRVAKWHSSMCRSPHARCLGAFRPREVDCTRAKDPRWYAPAGFHKVQHTSPAWPVHQTRPNRGVGLRRRIGRRIDKRVEDLLISRSPTRRAGSLSHCQNGRLGVLRFTTAFPKLAHLKADC